MKLDDYQPISYVNFSSLIKLDLLFNNFVNTTFDWLQSLTSLVILDLMSNHIQVPMQDAFKNVHVFLQISKPLVKQPRLHKF